VPVIIARTHPELTLRPSIPVMTHSLDQEVVTRKATALKCKTKIIGSIQEAKVEKQHRLVISFSVIPLARQGQSPKVYQMCGCDKCS